VTSVFSLFLATESTEKKIFVAPQDPTNQCYRWPCCPAATTPGGDAVQVPEGLSHGFLPRFRV
jgi:hypothetical protein